VSISKGALAFRARFAPSARQVDNQPVRQQQAATGPWLSAAGAAEFYGFKTPKAFRSWAARHGLIVAHLGRCARYAKRDIDAAMTFRSFDVHDGTLDEVTRGA
jgi:hypothetical protein